ncbi:hypothetical protein [Vescimonas sp.]|uniref:hypothetical protein n=1 Tax=Vescimonas sp. TaxID=2892404 RepID=UPI00307C91A1
MAAQSVSSAGKTAKSGSFWGVLYRFSLLQQIFAPSPHAFLLDRNTSHTVLGRGTSPLIAALRVSLFSTTFQQKLYRFCTNVRQFSKKGSDFLNVA